jgi:preprotein translocase subunit SecG
LPPRSPDATRGGAADDGILGFVGTLITGALVAVHMLLAIACITTVLMHSGKDAGLSGAFGVGGYSSSGGTQIMERNLTRVTVICGLLLVVTTIALGFRL